MNLQNPCRVQYSAEGKYELLEFWTNDVHVNMTSCPSCGHALLSVHGHPARNCGGDTADMSITKVFAHWYSQEAKWQKCSFLRKEALNFA